MASGSCVTSGGSPSSSRAPKLRHVKMLAAGEIEPWRLSANPQIGHSLVRPEHIPAGWGFEPINPHKVPEVRTSFARDGIVNPVYLWARWGRLWPRYGGSRVHFAQHDPSRSALSALVADYDDRYPWAELLTLEEGLQRFRSPPVGHTPHGWRIDDPDPSGEASLEIEIELWHVRHGSS